MYLDWVGSICNRVPSYVNDNTTRSSQFADGYYIVICIQCGILEDGEGLNESDTYINHLS